MSLHSGILPDETLGAKNANTNCKPYQMGFVVGVENTIYLGLDGLHFRLMFCDSK